jgi:uncharacterized protein YjbI with pentapeptide repeats
MSRVKRSDLPKVEPHCARCEQCKCHSPKPDEDDLRALIAVLTFDETKRHPSASKADGIEKARAKLRRLRYELEDDYVRAFLRSEILEMLTFSRAKLARAKLSHLRLPDARLSGADLRGANLSGADLSRANLFKANLSGANLKNALLMGANLLDANLTGANLTYAMLEGAHFVGADLTDADLSHATLGSHSKSNRADVREAILSRTIMPNGTIRNKRRPTREEQSGS